MSNANMTKQAKQIEKLLNQARVAFGEGKMSKYDVCSSQIHEILSGLSEQGVGQVLVNSKWMNTEDGTF